MERLRFDTIYVLLQVESQFGIVVPDRAAEEIRTMDQLLNFVLSKVGERPQNICVSSAAFYRLRRALGDLFGVPRECVRTNSHLEELVPLQDRQWHWPRLCKSVAHQGLSPLRGPGWSSVLPEIACAISFAIVFLLGVSLHGLGIPPLISANLIALGIAISLLVAWASHRQKTALQTCIPPSCKTVRDMVYAMVGHGQQRLVSDEHRPCDAEVWSILCGIVGDEFDVQPSSLTLASHPWSP